jgi:aarF domain-containing kinase
MLLYSVRVALCGIWKSTVQNDLESLKQFCQQLGIKDHFLFSLMLTGRTFQSHREMFNSATLTRKDVAAVKDTFLTRMDDVVKILRILPSSMLLVFRNINLMRSINRELGMPINRFSVMAKSYVINSTSSSSCIVICAGLLMVIITITDTV